MISKSNKPISYQDSGVDTAKAASLARRIGELAGRADSAKRRHLLQGIGGFAALYELPPGFKQPVLATATDGVGSKLELARSERDYQCLGVDLVAMCVNDLLCCGASPHIFLDYYATGSLDERQAEAVISGICDGCRQADCLLVGGETAEMPGIYDRGSFDLAGFAVGIVEKDEIISPDSIQAKARHYAGEARRRGGANQEDGESPQGDENQQSGASQREAGAGQGGEGPAGGGMNLVGLRSNGIHSNGFSLVRQLLAAGRLDAPREALMRPTRIYVGLIEKLRRELDIIAIAHITGGGITENLPRVLPDGFSAKLDKRLLMSWQEESGGKDGAGATQIFRQLQRAAAISDEEMLRTFNCGLGMILLHPATQTARLMELLAAAGEDALLLGSLLAEQDAEQEGRVIYV